MFVGIGGELSGNGKLQVPSQMVRFCQAPATGSVIPVSEMGSLEAGVLVLGKGNETHL